MHPGELRFSMYIDKCKINTGRNTANMMPYHPQNTLVYISYKQGHSPAFIPVQKDEFSPQVLGATVGLPLLPPQCGSVAGAHLGAGSGETRKKERKTRFYPLSKAGRTRTPCFCPSSQNDWLLSKILLPKPTAQFPDLACSGAKLQNKGVGGEGNSELP